MRVAAGILIIVGGFIGSSIWFGISDDLVFFFMYTIRPTDPKSLAFLLGFPLVLIRFLPLALVVIGGYHALKRKRWRWALTGAICSLLFPFTGIPAVILLIKSKGEFEEKS